MKLKKNVFLLLGFSLALWGGVGYAGDKESAKKLRVGQVHQGGVIVYMDGSSGLIAAPEEQSPDITWASEGYLRQEDPPPTGATGTAIGTGKTNTTLIVGVMGDGNYAARLCHDLKLNGYQDWFLPSKDELNMLYKNKRRFQDGVFNFYGFDGKDMDIYGKVVKALGGLHTGNYLSSSDDHGADGTPWPWSQSFATGGLQGADGNVVYDARGVRVRCFRAF